MSHFTVLVVGPDAEKQLQPYHEFECTGVFDEYVVPVDVTAEILAAIKEEGSLEEGLEYHGLEDRVVSDESEVDRNGQHKYAYVVVRDGVLVKAVRFTNPKAKWDFYQLGGRWTGFFPLKTGAFGDIGKPGLMTETAEPGHADCCFKSDIDFEHARSVAGEAARTEWQSVHALIKDQPLPESWEVIRERNKGNIDAARAEYNSQPAVIEFHKSGNLGFFAKVEDYLCTEAQYVQAARDSALVPFAVVMNGQWYEKGSMGWWGCVSDEKEASVWNAKVSEIYDSLPGDTLLSVYDCHI